LDDGDLHARTGEPRGERRSGLPGPDDDGIELLHDTASYLQLRSGRLPELAHVVGDIGIGVDWWKMTPSSGSNSPSHGAAATVRRVSAYPASQRARIPDALKSMSLV